jgi:sugar transferase EpsL
MKRIFDLLVTFAVFVVAGPILVLTALAVFLKLGRPVFFKQERGGFRGKPFLLWKFRTMTNDRDDGGNLLPDAERMTRFGQFLRSTSLDELPCLINVLKGELSLVGPRPFISRYLPLYTPSQMRRHDVHPGITGWAQVKGRNSLTWEEKFELDLWYVDHRSFFLDLKILFMTAIAVLDRRGISSQGEATAPEFLGKAP